MTIVIALKVGDGVVLGADSATTLSHDTLGYMNSYFNAEKLFNLVKGLPIGVVTYGLGGLAGRSIGSLLKDLRAKLSDPSDKAWYLSPLTYTMADAAERVRRYFYDELYVKQFPPGPDCPELGFFVAGYSFGGDSAEIWDIRVRRDGQCAGPDCACPSSEPVFTCWQGQPEAIRRILLGYSEELIDRLVKAGVPSHEAHALARSVNPLYHATMPIQDAIDLVHYLVELTCGFVRFAPGVATVAHPIDSAAITKHEGFRWIRRKHYYQKSLN